MKKVKRCITFLEPSEIAEFLKFPFVRVLAIFEWSNRTTSDFDGNDPVGAIQAKMISCKRLGMKTVSCRDKYKEQQLARLVI